MKYLNFILILLISPYSFAEKFDQTFSYEVISSIYDECNKDGSQLSKLAEIINVKKSVLCGCLSSKIKQEFDNSDLEKKLNEGYITIKDLKTEIELIGEKSGEYCFEKLYKD